MNNLSKKIIVAIRTATGKNNRLFLHEPTLGIDELKNLKECIKSNVVSSMGNFVYKFEKDIARFTKSKFAISTINGTSALHIALKVIDLKSNEEVLIPSLNYIASTNAILYCGAIPHFVDVSRTDLGIDVEKLGRYLKKQTKSYKNKTINKRSGNVIKAVITTHVYGNPMNIKKLYFLCKTYNLKLIEDAAEAIGSRYKNKHLGTIGDLGVLSFNGNKTITTGGGGMILTNDKKYSTLARHLTTIAKEKDKFLLGHDMLGYNYKLPNINAALGCAQIKKVNKLVTIKRKLHKKYIKAFSGIPEIEILEESKNSKSNYWLNTIILKNNSFKLKERIIKDLHQNNIFVKPSWKCLSKNKYLKKFQRMDLKNTLDLEKRIINLPSSPHLLLK